MPRKSSCLIYKYTIRNTKVILIIYSPTPDDYKSCANKKLSKPPTKVSLRVLTIWLQKDVRLNKSLAPFATPILSKNRGN